MIENLGIRIEDYDPVTNTASDITFGGRDTFIPFGKLIQGENGPKRTPELTF